MNTMQFGDRLRQARKNAGMTQVEAASVMYTQQSLICRYEQGNVMMPIGRVVEMARLYGVSIDWLCGLRDDE